MSFTVLTNGVDSLIVDRPPILRDRFGDRGKRTSVASSVSGERIVVEYDATPTDQRFTLGFTLLTAVQAETLSDLLDAGGVVTVLLADGGSTFNAVFGPEKSIEPIIGEHPDSDRDGGAINTALTWYKADVEMYRM